MACACAVCVAWFSLLAAAAQDCGSESDVEMSGVNFLQMNAASLAPATQGEQCLRFMHIPKTGGTSIDSANMHLPAGQRAFDSLMLETFLRVQAHTGGVEDLGQLYDDVHHGVLTYGIFMAEHMSDYRWLPEDAEDKCEDLHTPPSRSSDIALYYQEPGCTNFCVVREPLARFFSAFKMTNQECDPLSIESKALELLSQLNSRPYLSDCFFMPQVLSVYGVFNKSSATHQYCHRILHTENLDREFADLMKEFGHELQLPADDLMSTWTDHCNITLDELTPTTKAAVYEKYKADYEAFGYPKPSF